MKRKFIDGIRSFVGADDAFAPESGRWNTIEGRWAFSILNVVDWGLL